MPEQDAAESSRGQIRGGRTSRHWYYGETTTARFNAGKPQQENYFDGGQDKRIVSRKTAAGDIVSRPQVTARDIAREKIEARDIDTKTTARDVAGQRPQQEYCKDVDDRIDYNYNNEGHSR